MTTSVYKVQCKTFNIAKLMCGVTAENLATCGSEFANNPLTLFRARRPYRTEAANLLRQEVAAFVRKTRTLYQSS